MGCYQVGEYGSQSSAGRDYRQPFGSERSRTRIPGIRSSASVSRRLCKSRADYSAGRNPRCKRKTFNLGGLLYHERQLGISDDGQAFQTGSYADQEAGRVCIQGRKYALECGTGCPGQLSATVCSNLKRDWRMDAEERGQYLRLWNVQYAETGLWTDHSERKSALLSYLRQYDWPDSTDWD